MASHSTPRGRAPRRRFLLWMVLILLAAAWFRFHQLPDAPPGLTHDEADHGLTALGILDGQHAIYFTIGYGREPLYDYATAGMMALLGPGVLAGRLTAAFFSLLLVAAVAAWARRAFGPRVALLAAAGLAVGFWPVMAGRQMLRSITLPAIFSLAVLCYWEALLRKAGEKGSRGAGETGASGPAESPLHLRSSAPLHGQARATTHTTALVISGLLLGLTAYTYIPARWLWLLLPAPAVYLALAGRAERPRPRPWGTLGLVLLLAALVAMPLAVHLRLNPDLEVRIGQLSAPLSAAAAGDFRPLLDNALGSLRLFTVSGDDAWRYNLAGRPWLRPLTGLFFFAGLLYAVWLATRGLRRGRAGLGPSTGAFTALVWLALGLAPVLVTGPGLSMTQAIGLLPVLYVFPALSASAAYDGAARLLGGRLGETRGRGAVALAGLLLLLGGAYLTHDEYFRQWTNAPEVRVQYETTMVTALDYLDAHAPGPASVSTITPGRYHSPAVAALVMDDPSALRWFDGRDSLILPDEPTATLVLPGFTPPPAALATFYAAAAPLGELPTRPDDLDRPLRLFRLERDQTGPLLAAHLAAGPGLPLRFGDSLELLGHSPLPAAARPGQTLSVVTAWRLLAPLPDAALFTHLLPPGSGVPLAQADRLGAPGESWQAGDVLLQVHDISLPADLAPGRYPLAVGVYTTVDGVRLVAGGRDLIPLAEVTVE